MAKFAKAWPNFDRIAKHSRAGELRRGGVAGGRGPGAAERAGRGGPGEPGGRYALRVAPTPCEASEKLCECRLRGSTWILHRQTCSFRIE